MNGPNQSLAEAIVALRKQAGSHDKIAARLGTTRQRVISWEQGAFPRGYVDKLAEQGIPAELLSEPEREPDDLLTLAQVRARLRELEKVVDDRDTSISTALKALKVGMRKLERRLDELDPPKERAK